MRRFMVVAVVLLAGLTGCKRGSFFQQKVDDFTAYYNRFYNARDAYEVALQSIQRSDNLIDRSQYISLFARGSSGSGSFSQVIKKCADLLRGHPDSKWADDAILLIGKAYFHQQEYVGAEEKFRELIQIGSSLEDEAQFWLARTLIANNAFDEATRVVEESAQKENISGKWLAQIRLAMGELDVRQKDWEGAIVSLEAALPDIEENELAARGHFLLGQVYLTLENYERASAEFAKVRKFNPRYPLMFAALMSEAEVEGLHGDAARGLRLIRQMQRDDKFYEDRAQVNLLHGRVLAANGQPDEAFFIFDDLLYDKDNPVGQLRGRVHFALANLYHSQYKDYLRASVHYDTAATNIRMPRPEERVIFTPVAITDAAERAQTFKKFSFAAKRVLEIDSLLWLGGLDDAAFDSVIAQVRIRRQAEQAALQEEVERRQREERFLNIDRGPGGSRENVRGFAEAGQNRDAGFLFYLDPVLVQEARQKFEDIWEDRPLLPNWRRIDAVRGGYAAVGTPADSSSTRTSTSAGVASGGVQIDLSSIPRDPESRAILAAERANSRYEVANVLFLSMSEPDSAAAWYRMVIDEDNDLPVAARSYYALAEVQRALGDSTTANRLYQQILSNYPTSDFSVRARERLGLPVDPSMLKPDSLALAQSAYESAYNAWKQKAHTDAFSDMLSVANRYRRTTVAPKALLAAGQIYTEWATSEGVDVLQPIVLELDSLLFVEGPAVEPDSLAPAARSGAPALGPLFPQPLALSTLYKSIQTHYPKTAYSLRAKSIEDALTAILKERERIAASRVSRQDSLEMLAAALIPVQIGAAATPVTPPITEPATAPQDVAAVQVPPTQPPQRTDDEDEEMGNVVGRPPQTIAPDSANVPPDLAIADQPVALDSTGVVVPVDNAPVTIAGGDVNAQACRIISELNTIYFDIRQAQLDDSAKSLLKENLDVLLECPQISVAIRGFTDSVENSIDLSGERAEAVRAYYVSNGLAIERIQLVQGLGRARPDCAKEDPGEGCRVNRRSESIPGNQ